MVGNRGREEKKRNRRCNIQELNKGGRICVCLPVQSPSSENDNNSPGSTFQPTASKLQKHNRECLFSLEASEDTRVD